MALDLQQIRSEFKRGTLNREDLLADPIAQFEQWFAQTTAAQLPEPTAMVVSTVSAEGQPSSRIVYLKKLDEQGFVFYTNKGSRKAQEIANNNKVSLLFPWHYLERQVIVYGQAQQLSNSEVLSYFLSRPRDSQIGAWVSAQSEPISSKKLLLSKFAEMKAKFAQGEVPLPSFWGGYRIVPTQIEFWQGGPDRLHDRFMYRKTDSGWQIERLNP